MKRYAPPPKPEHIWDGTFPKADKNAKYSGGDGSQGDPFQISIAQDLAQLVSTIASGITQYRGIYFKQMNDVYINTNSIDPSLVSLASSGQGSYAGSAPNYWTPIGGALAGPVNSGAEDAYGFAGEYDGNCKTIHNVFYNEHGSVFDQLAAANLVGIFGCVYHDGTVKNLNTAGGFIGGDVSVGGIVGRNFGKVINCHNGNFVYSAGPQGAGGVVGNSRCFVEVTRQGLMLIPPEIDGCSNDGTVINNYFKGSGSPSGSAGGVTGENEGPVINSWNEGIVSGQFNVGGVVGSNQDESSVPPESGNPDLPITIDAPGYVNNCYNLGNIGTFSGTFNSTPLSVSAMYAGGIIGWQTGSAQNVYNIGNVGATGSDPNNSGKTPAAGQIVGEMKDPIDVSEVNDYFYLYDGATPLVPVGKPGSWSPSGKIVLVFDSSDSDKNQLLNDLNDWVDNNPGQDYSNWNRDTGNIVNNGFPKF